MHAECVALLLAYGAAQLENKNGLIARQEARGSACDVYATFERDVRTPFCSHHPFPFFG